MKRTLLIAASFCLLTGCVDRRYVITTDPPGAVVLVDGQPIGQTPVDNHFVYYGKHKFTLVKDGFQTQTVEQNIPAPWYEYPPFEFLTDVLLPWRVIDRREFDFKMQPVPAVRSDLLINQAENLRARGRAIAPPARPATSGSSPAEAAPSLPAATEEE